MDLASQNNKPNDKICNLVNPSLLFFTKILKYDSKDINKSFKNFLKSSISLEFFFFFKN
jgi:hypothetical protein